jgi:hypothetical protein
VSLPIYYEWVEKGGHVAAWEQPMIFAQALRVALRLLGRARGRGRILSTVHVLILECHRCKA